MHNEHLQHNLLKHITAQVDNSFHGEKISIRIQLKRQTRLKSPPFFLPPPPFVSLVVETHSSSLGQ